jgi:diguanylate cyclase (GGDEF)-like protein
VQGAVTSYLGLAMQATGIALIAALCAFLQRSIDRRCLRSWCVGWLCLATALFALLIMFRIRELTPILQPVYFFGEYAFAFLVIAGCREYASGTRLVRGDAGWAAPALLLAMTLPHVGRSFSQRFILQAAVMALLFAIAFWQLERARRGRPRTLPGVRIMAIALLLLTIDFFHYVPVISFAELYRVSLPSAYIGYASLYDLIFEVLLAFGMVTVVMEDVNRELQAANEELRVAHDAMQNLARVDPLTETLNRHAFYSLVEDARRHGATPPEGTVAIVDIDSLKPINDAYGHAAGDESIRAVATAIRSIVRAADLVIRWGGDEFLVILIGVPEDEATRRLDQIGEALRETTLRGMAKPVALSVSFGVASFGTERPLERAIEAADREMYRQKQAAKGRERPA